jgi:hypothetical protein
MQVVGDIDQHGLLLALAAVTMIVHEFEATVSGRTCKIALPTVGTVAMQRTNVLSIQRISAEDRAKIEAVDPTIQLTDAGGWYDGEIRETWPAFTSARYLAPSAMGSGTHEERRALNDKASPGRFAPQSTGRH